MREIRFTKSCTIEGSVPAARGCKQSSRSGYFEVEKGAILNLEEARAKELIRAGLAVPNGIFYGSIQKAYKQGLKDT